MCPKALVNMPRLAASSSRTAWRYMAVAVASRTRSPSTEITGSRMDRKTFHTATFVQLRPPKPDVPAKTRHRCSEEVVMIQRSAGAVGS